MKSSLQIGVTGQLSTQVGPGQTISLGGGEVTVFSTPSMINLMEHAAREAMRPHLQAGEESVGVDVQITHSAATPPSTEVVAEAVVTKIDKNVVSFDVIARDRWGEIGRGSHRRAVIKTASFAERLAQQKPSAEAAATSTTLPPLATINCQHSGAVLRMNLNRPEKKNAINAAMTRELEQVVDWLSNPLSDIRVVIVSGTAGNFSAGDDVGDLPDDAEAARNLSLRRGALYQRMTSLPQVFVAAIDGLALGGGLVFASACDFRIATHRALLGLPEVTLGWPPNYGLGIVQSLIGRGRTLELAVTGTVIDARRAHSIGLVGSIVATSQLESTVSSLADQTASLPADAIAAAKRLLSPGGNWSDENASAAFAACLATETAHQSIARFRR